MRVKEIDSCRHWRLAGTLFACGAFWALVTGCSVVKELGSDDTCEAPSEVDGEQSCGPGDVSLTDFGLFDFEITVCSIEDLKAAIDSAQPGTRIEIAPGNYATRLTFTAENSGTPEKPILVTSRDGLGSVIIDGAGATITIKLAGASHIKLSGLEITGGGYHGVFLDKGSQEITIEGNRIYDNIATAPLNSHAEVKGSSTKGVRPAKVVIRDNEIFHTIHPPGGNFQGIDCNRCDDFHIVGNYIHDINAPTEQSYSYFDRGSCIQMKSGSSNTIIERNVIEACNIGIVYGGEGLESPEHIGGIVRNNIIIDSVEMAIAVVNVDGGKIYNNTLFNNGESIRVARDIRFSPSVANVDAQNNILDHPIREEDGLSISKQNNFVVGKNSQIFVSAAKGDFRLAPKAKDLIDHGADLSGHMVDDHAGKPRPKGSGFDIGAHEAPGD